mmetsp:Transcript_19211/g.48380  ORF Transcript_19211/g.48380 Transcript_19211/m.48380 type:complete len:431 (+) Transcript_19211:65-1357(+)
MFCIAALSAWDATTSAPTYALLGDERLAKMTKPELEIMLKDMGRKTSGSKAELVQRCYDELLFGDGSYMPRPLPRRKRRHSTGASGAASGAAPVTAASTALATALVAAAAEAAAGSPYAPMPSIEAPMPHRIPVHDLEVGAELTGVVVRIVPFGCFVDVGAVREGLVPIARISETYVDDVDLFVSVGQAVRVWVTYITDDGKLGLTMVRRKTSFLPGGVENKSNFDIRMRWQDVHEQQREEEAETFMAFRAVSPDEWLEGHVASITGWGIYVTLVPPGGGSPVEGMVHVSQIRDGYVEDPALEVQIGQTVHVRILDVKPALGKMVLTMREGEVKLGKPYPEFQDVMGFVGIPPSDWLPARVHHFTNFGIFVEMAPPWGGEVVQGCVHIKQVRDGWVQDLAEEVDIGQEVLVRILKLDVPAGKLYLSMKEP